MRVVAVFTDTPEMLEYRKQHGQAHLDFLRANQSEILVGGGLRDEEGGVYVGGLWIMEVASLARAKAIIEQDPYYVPEFRSYQLKVWGKAFDEYVII
ncbi:YciI family protein [Grimontia marina]|uniref:YciI-like protein n=1 Tax=Grimontia marina TaxID=646534 RepID=A0A128FIV6_9GAMM|nr:YciI family protein [Grimontia marina]CZF86244.1 YciI-like protein [Grimontia marina]